MPIARTARVLPVAILAIGLVTVSPSGSTSVTAEAGWPAKLDSVLAARTRQPGRSRIIIRAANGPSVPGVAAHVRGLGGRVIRALTIVDAVAVEIPNALLSRLASSPFVERMSVDRAVAGAMARTRATVGADVVRQQLGYDGSGIGVAIIDSGVNAAHDDLAPSRVVRFVDFVNGRETAYDDYGHGTHVAGIIGGSGYDSGGGQAGIAPGADLVVLKALDASGRGRISDVIAALDYATRNKDALHIRVVNLSVATGVYESYVTDPLTLAAKRAVDAGLVVVAAAGNNGRSALGTTQYAGVTAPGNAPWVLTVGASSHMGTTDRDDDTMAAFSSRGPAAIDYAAKPDIVAPGVGIESLTDPGSTLYGSATAALLPGTIPTAYLPYLSLSGTSMSAPVVAGTVALMLQANPGLRPNAVKAILQYTAQPSPSLDALTQGAGFLNAQAAVRLAEHLGAPDSHPYPSTDGWSLRVIWGNRVALGGRLTADANAWAPKVTWGDVLTPSGDRVRWGVTCTTSLCDGVSAKPWQADPAWLANVVWGTLCGGSDCPIPWRTNIVSATTDAEADTVVWGTLDVEMDTVVWGTMCGDPSCDPILWDPR